MESPGLPQELFKGVQERNALLSRSFEVVSRLQVAVQGEALVGGAQSDPSQPSNLACSACSAQVDVDALLWEACSTGSSPGPPPLASSLVLPGAATVLPPQQAAPTGSSENVNEALYEAVQERNGLLHRVVDTINRLTVRLGSLGRRLASPTFVVQNWRTCKCLLITCFMYLALQVDAHGLLWELDSYNSKHQSLSAEPPLVSPVPFPTLSPGAMTSSSIRHTTHAFSASHSSDAAGPLAAASSKSAAPPQLRPLEQELASLNLATVGGATAGGQSTVAPAGRGASSLEALPQQSTARMQWPRRVPPPITLPGAAGQASASLHEPTAAQPPPGSHSPGAGGVPALSPQTAAFVSRAYAIREQLAAHNAIALEVGGPECGLAAGAEAGR